MPGRKRDAWKPEFIEVHEPDEDYKDFRTFRTFLMVESMKVLGIPAMFIEEDRKN
jgi:hypothetical protein